MTDTSSDDRAGFEWRGRFYPWSVTDIGKDLMLLDRIAQMPPSVFFELLDDVDDQERTPVLLTLIATSLRAGHPEWSVDRIYRTVMGLNMTADIDFVSPETGDGGAVDRPPAETGPETSAPGRSPSNGSSLPSTPQEALTSETSSVTRP
jgi:hypothetical protein